MHDLVIVTDVDLARPEVVITDTLCKGWLSSFSSGQGTVNVLWLRVCTFSSLRVFGLLCTSFYDSGIFHQKIWVHTHTQMHAHTQARPLSHATERACCNVMKCHIALSITRQWPQHSTMPGQLVPSRGVSTTYCTLHQMQGIPVADGNKTTLHIKITPIFNKKFQRWRYLLLIGTSSWPISYWQFGVAVRTWTPIIPSFNLGLGDMHQKSYLNIF